MRMLIDILNNHPLERRGVVMPADLILRASTARPLK
jgi:hypothetical protein